MAKQLSEVLGEQFSPENIQDSINVIKQYIDSRPRIALILGSGWTGIKDHVENPVVISLNDIPHFPKPKVAGHGNELISGSLAGQRVIILSGRKHMYEGEGLALTLYPIEIFKNLGVEIIGLTNAAGSARPEIEVGHLMVIKDHLDSTLHRQTESLKDLLGNDRSLFLNQPVYDAELVDNLINIGNREDLPVHAGVYAYTFGPFYESPSEVRAVQNWGGDALGMSTVPEAVFARLRGMRVFALSGITNMGTGLAKVEHSHLKVKEEAGKLAPRATRLLTALMKNLN